MTRQTAKLDAKIVETAQAQANGKTPGQPAHAQTGSLADAVSALGRMAVNPNERPDLPDGVAGRLTTGARGRGRGYPPDMFHAAAIDTVYSLRNRPTERVGPDYLPAAPDRILALSVPLDVAGRYGLVPSGNGERSGGDGS